MTAAAEPAPDRSWSRVPRGVLVGAALTTLIGVLALTSHQTTGRTHALTGSWAAGAAAGRSAVASHTVGMPIPVGNMPVKPVRILLDITGHPVPANERIALGNWITRTQNAQTHIMIQDGSRISQPLTGTTWATTAPTPRHPGTGMIWLRAGTRTGRNGALIHIGSQRTPELVAPQIRESGADGSPQTLASHNQLAASIARQIMITSRPAPPRPGEPLFAVDRVRT